jgi:hypothetical protein
MDQEDRKSIMQRKEMLDQEFAEIKKQIKPIAETMYEFSSNLAQKPEHVVIVEIASGETKYREDKIYFSKDRLKKAFNIELIDDYIMSLQRKGRELEELAQTLND